MCPSNCIPYLASRAQANPNASVTCSLGFTNEILKSDEVCPACTTKVLNLTERAQGRRAARREERLVDKMDDDVAGNQQAMESWSAKQQVLQERVDVFVFTLETGMVDE
ncbi:MAG: hypothetical protein ALECFALPRED_010370 [Alectoria fallacina]|uniref:Uncharacterized protein n=1 Tax=Alectoria fallacina TaxID=1903189 RepID=A0A8H3IET7_9LECA|nr:MAG: hypothetical protein ALECFALPRED_010370 [Alectoria fallacina]